MAEVTMIGWLVSPIIKIVIEKAQSYMASQYKGVTSARGELARLASTLTQIQTVVAAVERRPAKDPNQAAWLRQLRDAVYEAEDVLDDFDYELLEARVGSGGKVSGFASSSIKIGKRLIGADECANKLREILKKLDNINTTTETLLHVVKLNVSTENLRPKIAWERVTSSLLTEVKVFGRDKERDEIIGVLLMPVKGSVRGDRSIPVLPIVGVGGVGKTTLAQLVYNDRRVEEYFEVRMWVCVSDRFDEISITREILQSATDEKHDEVVNFDKLQRILKSMLLSKRFLLVLDDVRNDEEKRKWENKERWRKLLAPLQFGESGSRILVTTRMEMVAEMLDSMSPVFLKGLARDEYWLLFKKCAFGSEEFSRYPELQVIGREIAAMLNGSPLAAKAVGGRLKHNLDIKEWKTILEREVWDDIMPVLISSYQNLPVHLQRCFAYCSIFPKHWKFEPKKLVNLWIAQDFIRPSDTMERRMEDVGRDYFDDLLSRSFFQTLKQGYRTYYVIHDLMHDLAQSVSIDECCRIEGDRFNRRIPPTVRHISVTTNHLDQLKNTCELKNLRTVIVFKKSEFNVDHFQDDILRELKGLRALDLTGCDIEELQEAIGRFTHLRYLALCGTLKTLPESVSKLYHLQVLNMPKKCQLNSLPKDMSKLVSLRHLNIDSEYVSMISGIGKLTCLQGSLEFHVKNHRGQNIGELKDMKELQGQLTIKNLDDVMSKEEAAEADLLNKKHIKKLRLEWDSCRRTCRPIVDAEVLEGLRPNPSLKELHITRYQGASSPSWMETKWLWNLKSIYLTNCRRWEVLPPLGQLPFLKVLHIKEMSAVKQVGYEFYGIGEVKGFPSLRELHFDDMPEWVEWSGAADTQLFPRLRSLKISNCPKLMKLPPTPLLINFTIECAGLVSHLKLYRLHSSSSITFTLSTSSIMILHEGFLHRDHLRATKALNIRCCEDPVSVEGLREFISLRKLQIFQSYLMDKSLSTCLQELKSLSTLEIVDCPNVTSLPLPKELSHLTTLQELCVKGCQVLTSLVGLQALPSLERLIIERCPKLTSVSLPADMRSLSSLKKLSIMYCPQLQSLPENGLPTSIKSLCLIGCHPALAKQLNEKEGPDWGKVAHIPKLIIR
ncbi:putative disease resistance protein RGA4 [Elaeis guineensis]|uniref:Disease resistance protein RGA3 n=1 Tax=Elaeis guineensis var. tenera TaxID=51953 RepID=A0A6J0PLH9_ELAGV|nr:putative disease resistance protein RGA3 [Elaeis guineensis]XP_019708116.1 putative disease resistance protein RGA3 [Elaeis guineensis]XP_019708117.1 putative disease resistance protein RGA3 [Elaeis guineensis]XP_019708118.1 putative disease resistance protein RGA3 [Elaeis guineensis]XP_019708119.1 putative disease resistance protein RGA3 [Elaeis guineensis]XP_029121826.1 putative disease resistance protein RGA3 [Elaeis guineensis]XP_029121827.1 putative disease resistance protein RGA3 [El